MISREERKPCVKSVLLTFSNKIFKLSCRVIMRIKAENLSEIHSLYFEIKRKYPGKSKRLLYFLATVQLLDPGIDLEMTMKLRPYGGLIGIDDSKLDDYLNWSKILRLHAVLHDAAGYVYDTSKTGPGYLYAWNCHVSNSCFLGHFAGIMFCLVQKLFNKRNFSLLEL